MPSILVIAGIGFVSVYAAIIEMDTYVHPVPKTIGINMYGGRSFWNLMRCNTLHLAPAITGPTGKLPFSDQ